MNIESYRNYCLSLPGVTEDFPFDNNTLVFKVVGKIFALCDVDNFESINLMCDPVRAVELREQHPEIRPGYHMNKKHWNTVSNRGDLQDEMIYELITHSHNLVVAKLPKRDQQMLKDS